MTGLKVGQYESRGRQLILEGPMALAASFRHSDVRCFVMRWLGYLFRYSHLGEFVLFDLF